jgi:hypothetical protein
MVTTQTMTSTRTLSTVIAAGALIGTIGCGAQGATSTGTQTATAQAPATVAAPQPAGAPIVVSCEPNQRTLVRPVIVNVATGATMSHVECVTNPQVVATAAAPQTFAGAAPAVVNDAYRPVRVSQTASDGLEDARVVTTEPTVVRPVQTRQVYREPVRRTRSVKKSAIIIGSSAGIGAGVGAAVGGKKGALIGAAIGGGGATVWDQVTRRKE